MFLFPSPLPPSAWPGAEYGWAGLPWVSTGHAQYPGPIIPPRLHNILCPLDIRGRGARRRGRGEGNWTGGRGNQGGDPRRFCSCPYLQCELSTWCNCTCMWWSTCMGSAYYHVTEIRSKSHLYKILLFCIKFSVKQPLSHCCQFAYTVRAKIF